MDLNDWIMRKKGFDISATGYFLYCDGDLFSEYDFLGKSDAVMKFMMSLIPYEVSIDWIEPTLLEIDTCLNSDTCPDHHQDCEFGTFIRSLETS